VKLDQQCHGKVETDARFCRLRCDQGGCVAKSDDVVQIARPAGVDRQELTRGKRRNFGAMNET
jgi:hypothetical protein